MPSLSLCFEMKLELQVHSEWFQTIFPKTETMLNKSRYQKALTVLDEDGDMGEYVSMMDFLACTTFSWLKPHAIAFYEGRGKLLKYQLTEETIKAYDMFLSEVMLPYALNGLKSKEVTSWTQATTFIQSVFKLEETVRIEIGEKNEV